MKVTRFAFATLVLLGTISLLADPAAIVRTHRPVPLDQPDNWPRMPAPYSMVSSEGRAQWAGFYDDANLYLLVTVVDSSPMKNSTGSSDPAMMLKGGDAVGFCFGPVGGKGQNQRILTAMLEGRPAAVAYRPDSERKRPYTFASPVSTLVINDVAPILEVKVAMIPASQGYAVGVAIPWTVLGFTPRDGLTFPFDVQVIFSDPGGGRNIATAWWHSSGQGPLATMDLPTEAQLYPDQRGTARLYSSAPGGGWRWMDRDLTLHGKFGSLAPKAIDSSGVPDYQGGVYTPHFPDGLPENFAPFLQYAAVSRPASDGAVYYLANIGPGMGEAFWDRAGENKLIKVRPGSPV